MSDRTFRPYEPDQLLLLPPSLQDWLPADHVVYFLADLVDGLDVSAIEACYGGATRGNAPYDPRLLVKVLFYAYCMGVPASRQIARKLQEDVAFRVLAANTTPDFRTIADFRDSLPARLKGIGDASFLRIDAGSASPSCKGEPTDMKVFPCAK